MLEVNGGKHSVISEMIIRCRNMPNISATFRV